MLKSLGYHLSSKSSSKMVNPKSIPILVILFNRPEKSMNLAKSISLWQPNKVYIALDGPRDKTEGIIVQKSLQLFIDNLDTEILYEIKKNNSNLGCSKSIEEGINWAFSKEEYLIILEDDCLPSIDFFQFCSEALAYYKNENNIKYIGGSNLSLTNSFAFKFLNRNHYWVRYAQIWGWATWKDRWINRSKGYTRKKLIKALWWDPIQLVFWLRNRKKPLWDVKFGFLNLIENEGYGIMPSRNLIRNTGFDDSGSNYSSKSKRNIDYFTENLNFEVNYLKSSIVDLTIFYKRYFPIFFEKLGL